MNKEAKAYRNKKGELIYYKDAAAREQLSDVYTKLENIKTDILDNVNFNNLIISEDEDGALMFDMKSNEQFPYTRLKRLIANKPSDYILTDIMLPAIKDVVIEAKGELYGNGDCSLFGTRTNNNTNIIAITTNDSPSETVWFKFGAGDTYTGADRDRVIKFNVKDIKYPFIFHAELNNSYIIDAEDNRYNANVGFDTTGEKMPPVSLAVLGTNNENGLITNINDKRVIEWLKIWESGILTHELVPVLDNNNIPALYDTITDNLYYSYGNDLEYEFGRKKGYFKNNNGSYVEIVDVAARNNTPIYTPGYGITIDKNNVISCNFADGSEEEY